MSWLGNRTKANGLRIYPYIRSIRDDVSRNKVDMWKNVRLQITLTANYPYEKCHSGMLGIVLCTGYSDAHFHEQTFGCSPVIDTVKHLNVIQKLFSKISG